MRSGESSTFGRIFTLEESNLIKEAFLKASKVFESWGYEFMKVPLVEPWEDQRLALGPRSRDSIAFKDTRTGDILALRSDFTTQVLRTVANLRDVQFPLRVYYFGSVVSSEGEASHTGVELLGVEDLEGDAEVISAVYSFLRDLGLDNLTVNVGHVGIVESLISSVQDREEVRRAFIEKDLTFLRHRFGGSPVSELPLIQGGREVLGLLDRIGLKRVKEELLKIGDLLSHAGVNFVYDLSEIRSLPYYTGVVFEIFHPAVGSAIAGGGRYDRLSEVFGVRLPSTGGTVYLDRIVDVLKPLTRSNKDLFIIDTSPGKRFGFKLASELRRFGYSVARDIVRRDPEESVQIAFRSGYRVVLLIEEEDKVKVYRSPLDFTETTLDKVPDLIQVL